MKTNAIMHKQILTSMAARMRPLSWLMVCLGLVSSVAVGPAISNPVGPQVVNGTATFAQQGNILTITNSNNAIINWQNFSINADEITRFLQPNANSSVLNRVQGQYSSQILGALQSNGKVFLINPNGIVFGNQAKIDVAGMIASSLNLSNQDFLSGKKNFSAGDNANNIAGKVENRGAITTPAGGQIFLIAPNVENSGVINAPNGDIVLAAGRSVQLVDSANPDLQVVVSAPENQAINLGQIISHGGRVGIYGALVNQRGTVNANSAVVGENGKIYLKASQDAVLEAGSVTSANGVGKGGDIAVLGQRVIANGNARVEANGDKGGGTVLFGGDYQGKNAAVKNAEQSFFSKNASISADALVAGNGGKVILWSDKVTQAYGNLSARGAGENGLGGLVEVSSKKFLDFRAHANLAGGKPGKAGTLLLDPDLLVIHGGSGDGTTDGTDTFVNQSSSAGSINYDDSLSVVYQSELEGIPADTNIVLEASRRIETAGTFDNAGVVVLANNNSLTMNTRNGSNDSSTGSLGIDLTTSDHGTALEFKTSGTGSISLNAGTASSQIANLTVGNLTTGGGHVNANAHGNVTIDGGIVSQDGNVEVNAKNITLNSNAFIDSGYGQTVLHAFAPNSNLIITPGASLLAKSSGVGDGIDLVADNITLPVNGGNTITLTGPGRVSIHPADNARDMSINAAKTGTKLELTPTELSLIDAGNVVLNTDAAQSVDSPTTLSNIDQLFLFGTQVNISQPLVLTGAEGKIRLEAAGDLNITGDGALSTTGAMSQIGLFADSMSLSGAAGTINAGGGRVSIAPHSSGTVLQVGAGAIGTAGILGITDTELRSVGGTGVLEIGNGEFGWEGNATVTSSGLDLTGGAFSGHVFLSSGATAGDLSIYGPLAVPNKLYLNSRGVLSTASTSSINAGNLDIVADSVDLQGAQGSIAIGTGTVNLVPATPDTLVHLGAAAAGDAADGTLMLSDSEINTISGTGILRIGNAGTGDMTIVGPITPTFAGSLTLISGADIGQLTGAIITADKLAIKTNGYVDLTEANMVNHLAAKVGNVDYKNMHFKFNNAASLNIAANIDGVQGILVEVDNIPYNPQNPQGVISLISSGTLMQDAGALLASKALYAEAKCVVLPEPNHVPNVAGQATGANVEDVFHFKTNEVLWVNEVEGFHGIAQNGAPAADAIKLASVSGDVLQSADASITTAGGLNVVSSGLIALHQAGGNAVGSFSASSNGVVDFVNTQALTVGGSGIVSNNSAVNISANGALIIEKNVNAGTAAVSLSGGNLQLGTQANGGVTINGNNILLHAKNANGKILTDGTPSNVGSGSTTLLGLIADDFDFTAAAPVFSANSSNGFILVRPETDNHAMNLGSNAVASWNADAVAFGENDASAAYTAGDISIGTPIAVPNKLGFFTGGGISQTAAISSTKLALSAGSVTGSYGGISLTSANHVSYLSAETQNGSFSFTNVVPLAIKLFSHNSMLIDGVTTGTGNVDINNTGAVVIDHPISTTSGGITVVAHSPLTVNAPITTTTGNISLEAGASGSVNDKLVVSANGPVTSTSGNITLKAGDTITLIGTVSSATGTVSKLPKQNPAAIPSLNDCIANPALPGCSTVLPSLNSCIASPSLPGCSVVLPSLASCTATPSLPGCGVVLPTLASCVASPSLPGCSVVLPSLTACIATPTQTGCSVVLPSVTACAATPSLPGCQVVLPTLTACIASPSLPGCSVVLPSLAVCSATPSLPGCQVVLPTLTACIATPNLPGCQVVLPNLTACAATPSLPGCQVVLPTLTACVATPSLPGCQVVLPNLTACLATPSLPGCQVILPNLTACVATPNLPGCQVVLPSLASCVATPSLPGCSVILPNLADCISTPSRTGCSAVLPVLTACVENPSAPGCQVILPSLANCVSTPTLPGCQVVLPNITACVATPTLPGCAAVLPNLASCIATPSLPGCGVILPALAQCIANPTAAGCTQVLPSLATCTANPSTAGCVVVLPATQTNTANTDAKPIGDALDSTVNIINTSSGSNALKPSQAPTIFGEANAIAKPEINAGSDNKANPPGTNPGDTKLAALSGNDEKAPDGSKPDAGKPEASKDEAKKDEAKKDEVKKDEKKDDNSSDNKDSGAKKDEPVKKLYCN